MLNKMTIKEFKEKLNNYHRNTCGSFNKKTTTSISIIYIMNILKT